jgi:hypothetical protein
MPVQNLCHARDKPYALESWPWHMDTLGQARVMLFWIRPTLAHQAGPIWPTIALISVVAVYANNERVPKDTDLEQHVQWMQCIMSKKLPMYTRIYRAIILQWRQRMERPRTPRGGER